MKALVGTFNQEKALVGAFSVIVKTGCGTDGSFYSTSPDRGGGVAVAGQCDLCNVNSIKVERRFRSQAVTVVCSAPACCGTLSCNPSPCTTQPLTFGSASV